MPDAYEPPKWYGLRGWGMKVATAGICATIAVCVSLYAAKPAIEYAGAPVSERKYDYATRAKRSLEKRTKQVLDFFRNDGEISDMILPKEKTP